MQLLAFLMELSRSNMITKITVTNDDGTTEDFFLPVAAPTQVVEIKAGEVIEVKGV